MARTEGAILWARPNGFWLRRTYVHEQGGGSVADVGSESSGRTKGRKTRLHNGTGTRWVIGVRRKGGRSEAGDLGLG